MPRFLCEAQYCGDRYCGWQTQKNGGSVQEVLEKAVSLVFRERIKVEGTSRTDAGVHAEGQVVFFDCLPPVKRLETLFRSVNAVLPPDIRLTRWRTVGNDYNPRKRNVGKHYRYDILNAPVKEVFRAERSWWVVQPVALERMAEAASRLEGKHDFTAFSGKRAYVSDPRKTLTGITVRAFPTATGKLVSIDLFGDSFLKQMARIIVGSLLDVGLCRGEAEMFDRAFRTLSRKDLGRTAPSKGLVLKRIFLDPDPFLLSEGDSSVSRTGSAR